MQEELLTYKRIKEGGRYVILIHGLWNWFDGEFRVSLYEEGDYYHTVELFDVNFTRAADRRRLNDYILGLQRTVKVCDMGFSTNGLQGKPYYSWENFKKRNESLLSDKFWFQNMNVPQLNN